ncbi:hypothetical protein [Ruegeria arenilitoris]|uniref:hypothetical protein n=1 Tax=Ruegeria arenilitoris TaxID=1173585 RepID=UPI0014799FEA|nr:hypothetical protein [Ruegeria arenilitoris]
MYIMYADEADQDGSKEYLIYASVFFPSDQILKIHNGMIGIRNKFGFAPGDKFKFSPGGISKSISREAHAAAKNEALKLAAKHQYKACCYITPHSIAKGQTHENRLKFGINTLLMKFDQFLRENGNAPGVAKFDRTSDFKQEQYFKEIFENGILFQKDNKSFKLNNIVSIDNTLNGTSHLSSLTDIVVGSFRFVINEPNKDLVGAKLLKSLSNLLWGVKDKNGVLLVRERGFCIRPKNVAVAGYNADINALISRLNAYAKQT